jgi:hypothetical protein
MLKLKTLAAEVVTLLEGRRERQLRRAAAEPQV